MRCQLHKIKIVQNMFLYRSAAEHESELRNFVEQFKKHSKNKVNDLVNANMSSKVGQ